MLTQYVVSITRDPKLAGISFELKPMSGDLVVKEYLNQRRRGLHGGLDGMDPELQYVDRIMTENCQWEFFAGTVSKADPSARAVIKPYFAGTVSTAASVDASAIKARELNCYLIGRLDGYLIGSVIPAAQ